MLPVVVAAIQARKATTVPNAVVIITAIGLSSAQAGEYGKICDDNNVQLELVTREIFGDQNLNAFVDAFFSGSKFTFGALGRLFLDQLIDPVFDQLLYIDGDVHITGSLDPLITANVAQKSFLAAPDPKSFFVQGQGVTASRTRAYMRELGLSTSQYRNYFNSGVLRISRDGWKDIGLAAWDFLKSNPDRCVCHDQSALNAVGHNARAPLSLKWNFPPFYRYYGLLQSIDPRIVHYMSQPKPWNGTFQPWDEAAHQPYLDFIDRYPNIRADLRIFSDRERLKYTVWQNAKRLEESLHPRRRALVRSEVAVYEEAVVV